MAVLSFLISSIEQRPRIITDPCPVKYAERAPPRPKIIPPVGKSGPGTYVNNSSGVISGLSIIAMQAETTSPRLCGGIFVAIPTAIPPEPFTKMFGNRAGNTSGSIHVSS